MRSDLQQSYEHCERIARQSSSSFFLAFRALPKEKFREMCVLYAFMRNTDDLGDDARLPVERRRQLLTNWNDDLTRACQGSYVPCRILPAVSDLVLKREIPLDDLRETIRGVQADLTPRTFETFADLESYCYQVAGVVGLSCLRIWGFQGPEPRESAIACGTAFQLTNILRDLKEDASHDRFYLPRQELERFGFSRADLQQGRRDGAFRELMRFQVQRAWGFYDQALPLAEVLSPEGRRIYLGLFDLYSSLLRQIEQANYDVYRKRIRIPLWKKARVALCCLLMWDPPVNRRSVSLSSSDSVARSGMPT